MLTYLTAPEAKTAPHTIHLFAEAIRPIDDPEYGTLHESQLLDIVLANDGTPYGPRIRTLVTASLGQDWQVASWWCPKPEADEPFWLKMLKTSRSCHPLVFKNLQIAEVGELLPRQTSSCLRVAILHLSPQVEDEK